MLKMYGSRNRKFLGTDTALFLILKITLQNLAQTRLLRVKSTSTFLNLEERINTIQSNVESPSHKNQLMAAIKRTHTMLNSAQKERVKSTKDYKVQHSTLLQACSNDGNHQPSQESPENGNGSGHNEEEYDDIENSDQSSCSCNKYGVLLRHLRTCPATQLQIPQEITDLSMHYHDIEESIKTIQETIHNLSTDELLTEVQRLSDFVTTDMSDVPNIGVHNPKL